MQSISSACAFCLPNLVRLARLYFTLHAHTAAPLGLFVVQQYATSVGWHVLGNMLVFCQELPCASIAAPWRTAHSGQSLACGAHTMECKQQRAQPAHGAWDLAPCPYEPYLRQAMSGQPMDAIIYQEPQPISSDNCTWPSRTIDSMAAEAKTFICTFRSIQGTRMSCRKDWYGTPMCTGCALLYYCLARHRVGRRRQLGNSWPGWD